MNISSYLELFKLRIGVMIALTAVVAYGALAPSVEPLHLLVLAVTMLMGSASSSILNHYYDRDMDRKMKRTQKRPLATDQMENPANILWLAAALLVAGVAIAGYTFNAMVGIHLFLGAFFYGVVYTIWLKRRTWWNIVIGGAAGSFAVLAGAAAVEPTVSIFTLSFAVVLFLWTPSHFWALAIVLKEDYQRASVPMLPVVKGNDTTAKYIFVNSLALVGVSLVPAFTGDMGWFYGLGAAASGGYFLYQNIQLIKEPTVPVARANFFGSMKYLGLLFVFILLDARMMGG